MSNYDCKTKTDFRDIRCSLRKKFKLSFFFIATQTRSYLFVYFNETYRRIYPAPL